MGCLSKYESCTKDFRPVESPVPDKLCLSYIHPHKPLISSTLERWIKFALKEEDIDTSMFSAYSVRSAATSEEEIKVFQCLKFCL